LAPAFLAKPPRGYNKSPTPSLPSLVVVAVAVAVALRLSLCAHSRIRHPAFVHSQSFDSRERSAVADV
jgi:hypothetical protein